MPITFLVRNYVFYVFTRCSPSRRSTYASGTKPLRTYTQHPAHPASVLIVVVLFMYGISVVTEQKNCDTYRYTTTMDGNRKSVWL